MNHTEFDFYDDLTFPLYSFLLDNDVNLDLGMEEEPNKIYPNFPPHLF